MAHGKKLMAMLYLDQNNIIIKYNKLDYSKLLAYLNTQYNVFRATSYFALDQDNDSQRKFVTYIINNGWRCETVDISVNTNVDNIISTDMVTDRFVLDHKAVILISGDGDFSYPLNYLSKAGYFVHVIGGKEGTSRELLRVADKVTYLEDIPDIVLIDQRKGSSRRNEPTKTSAEIKYPSDQASDT